MEINQTNLEFFNSNMHKTRSEYYLNLFKKMTEDGFKERVRKYCHIAREHEKNHFLGKLNTDSLVLLVTMQIILGSIEDKERNLYSRGSVSAHASHQEIQEEREVCENIQNQIQKAANDYWNVRERLEANIKEVFNTDLSLLLESTNLLKKLADFKYQNPGHAFTYDGEDIYIVNWYPMGGD